MAAAIGPLTVLWTASTDQTQEGLTMKTFVIEREIPGASQLSEDELKGIASASCAAVTEVDRPYRWMHTYVAGDRFYCIHQAEDAEAVLEHARIGGFPADRVSEVAAVFDATWGRP
jgi:hypothetical protein